MKESAKLLISLVCLQVVGMSGAGAAVVAEADSTSRTEQLKEVTVEAEMRRVAEDKTVFIPSSTAKKISSDGSSLLRNMAIATVYVSPVDGSISLPGGAGYATFIDFMPASKTDVDNIRAAEVKRVEIYDFSTDPRFGNAPHVINFVMVKYEYGGYTRADASQRFIDNRGEYSAYSKMTYKKMTYDVGGGYTYQRSHKSGRNENSIYRFPTEDISYGSITEKAFSFPKSGNAFVRARYGSEKTAVSNAVSFSSSKSESSRTQKDTYSSAAYRSGLSESVSDGKDLSIYWKGELHQVLPHNMMLVAGLDASYGLYKNIYSFKSGEEGVYNNTRDKAWGTNIDLSLRKSLGRHSIGASFFGSASGHNLRYDGTTPAYHKGEEYSGCFRVQTALSFGKFYVQPSASILFEHEEIGGISQNRCTPKYFIWARYNISQKQALNFSSELYYANTPLSMLAPNIQLSNGIYGIQGNPGLKPSLNNSVNLQYQYFPTNKLSLAAFASYDRTSRNIVPLYEPTELPEGEYMIRTLVNDGFMNEWRYGLTAALSLLKNSLTLRGTVKAATYAGHSVNHVHATRVSYNFQASYSFKNIYILLNYLSESRQFAATFNLWTPHFYGIRVGWTSGDLNLSCALRNIFTSSTTASKSTTDTPGYFSMVEAFSPTYRRAVELSLSYSFSYGKKVSHDSEDFNSGGVGSALLE